MANNSYAQLIDDFEAGILVIEGESLTDYIKRMGGVDYESKANGGIMGYAEGGLMSPEEYFLGKEKYMKEEQIENMRREYNEYLYKQNHGPRDEAANGGIMGYAIGGNIINQDINKYQNIDNQRAEVLQQDINASKGKGFKAQDLDTLKSIEFVNPTLTEFELQGLKDGSITKPGSYSKPQARLTNEEYLSRNNNLTANANNIARDFTFDTTSPVPEDIDMQYTVGNEFNVAPQNRSMFERGKDLASSGIAKAGKVGMDAFNLIKNNNPIGLLTSGFGKLGDMFEYKGGDVTVDENGNIISAADLNKMNARGGYYTDAARNARNRTKSLAAFRARGKTDSKRYNDLLLQEIKQEKARAKAKAAAAAATALAQRSFLANENRGGDGPQNNPQGGLGRQDYSRATNSDFASLANEMGIDFQNGGLATMFRQKR